MSLLGFAKSIIKSDYLTLGWIPEKGLKYQIDKGWYFLGKSGFILMGTPKKEFRRIHIFYVFPNKRNGKSVYELASHIPKKAQLNCVTGLNFWLRQGFIVIEESSKNKRRRTKFKLRRYSTYNTCYG